MNRRNLLKIAALGAVPGSLWAARSALAQADAIQFGCPVPMSGAFAANGKFADLGMKLALEQYGRVLDRPLAYTVLDTEGKPATAVRKVQEVSQQKGVKFFAGGILSSEALAMGKEVERAGGVFITTAGADEITGKDCNRATFRWSVPPSAPSSRPCGRWWKSCPRPSAGTHHHATVRVRRRPAQRRQGDLQERASSTWATATTRSPRRNSAAT